MKIIKNKDKRYQGVTLVHVDVEEAIRLIKSLSQQMMSKNPNVGREEFVTDGQEYFTIFVEPPEKKDEDVAQYELARRWGWSDEKIMEMKAGVKKWEDAQNAE